MLCAALTVAPVLLLATPGRAAPGAAASARLHARVEAPARARAAAMDGVHLGGASWVFPAAASAQLPTAAAAVVAPAAPATPTPPPASTPLASTPAPIAPPAPRTPPAGPVATPATDGGVAAGVASWYAAAPPGYCASPTLTFGTVVTVTDVATGVSVACTIDDRQAPGPGRVIDMSEQGFEQLAPLSQGLAEVSVHW